MTSNFPEKLDEALLRPGRIDRRVHLGHIDRRGAEQMFRRMFEPDPPDENPPHSTDVDVDVNAKAEVEAERLEKASLAFADQIPRHAITPAQLQEFLLQRHESASRAVDEIAGWVAEQIGQGLEDTEPVVAGDDVEGEPSRDVGQKTRAKNPSKGTVEKLVNGNG